MVPWTCCCWQDNGRATLVGPGPRTFGKGRIQNVQQLADGSGVSLSAKPLGFFFLLLYTRMSLTSRFAAVPPLPPLPAAARTFTDNR